VPKSKSSATSPLLPNIGIMSSLFSHISTHGSRRSRRLWSLSGASGHRQNRSRLQLLFRIFCKLIIPKCGETEPIGPLEHSI